MADLSELIERLEKAEGPSRILDYAIHEATNPALRAGVRFGNVPAYTSSIDVAVSLAERTLPTLSKIQLQTYVGGQFNHCEIETDDGDFEAHNRPNAALALVLATLRALQSKGGEA